MTDHLDTRIRALMREIAVSSIEPPPFPAERIVALREGGHMDAHSQLPTNGTAEGAVEISQERQQREIRIPKRRPRWVVGLATAVIVLVLGTIPVLVLMGDESERSDTASSQGELLGKWTLLEINDEPIVVDANGLGVFVTFSLDPDWIPRTTTPAGDVPPRGFALTGFSGCNGFSGRWDPTDDGLTFELGIQTLAGCTPLIVDGVDRTLDLLNQGNLVTDCLLRGVVAWTVDGDRLTLVQENARGGCQVEGPLVAVFVRADSEL